MPNGQYEPRGGFWTGTEEAAPEMAPFYWGEEYEASPTTWAAIVESLKKPWEFVAKTPSVAPEIEVGKWWEAYQRQQGWPTRPPTTPKLPFGEYGYEPEAERKAMAAFAAGPPAGGWPSPAMVPPRPEEDFLKAYADKPLLLRPEATLPPDWEGMTEEKFAAMTDVERYEWLQTHNYSSLMLTPEGKPITPQEVTRLLESDPTMAVTKVFALGGGQEAAVELQLFEASGLKWTEEELTARRAQAGRAAVTQSEQAKFKAQEDEIVARGVESLDDLIKAGATNEEIHVANEKAINDLIALYYENPSMIKGAEWRNVAEGKVWDALPKEVAQATSKAGEAIATETGGPRAAKLPPEIFDLEAMRRDLEAYGITVLTDYPYISPISQAHLQILPIDLIEKMRQYVEDKGIAWNDYLWLSSTYFGAARTSPQARWSVPRQW